MVAKVVIGALLSIAAPSALARWVPPLRYVYAHLPGG